MFWNGLGSTTSHYPLISSNRYLTTQIFFLAAAPTTQLFATNFIVSLIICYKFYCVVWDKFYCIVEYNIYAVKCVIRKIKE